MIDHADIDALVERAAHRDADAFRALYETFAPRLYRFALFRLHHASDAEDLVQRVFVKMIEALPRFEQRGLPFGAWVFRLARNAIIDFERSRRPLEDLDLAAASLGSGPGPDELAELRLERERLLDALRFLTPEQREVVTLRFFGDLSPAEIGSLLGKREGSIRALQFRALETLRRELAPTEAPASMTASTSAAMSAARPRGSPRVARGVAGQARRAESPPRASDDLTPAALQAGEPGVVEAAPPHVPAAGFAAAAANAFTVAPTDLDT